VSRAASIETEALLEMRDVAVPSLHDSTVAVMRGVNWTVNRAEFWVVTGPQRSGKSELLMLAAGLNAPLAGDYRAFGTPMPQFDEAQVRERLRLGLVFDGGKLFQRQTIAENVALPLCYHENIPMDAAWPRVSAMLDTLGLGAVADSTPATLQHELQMRAGLARALVLGPEILFLDNPPARDGGSAEAWWPRFLLALNRGHALMDGRPVTLVIASNEAQAWAGIATRFARMTAGRFETMTDAG
jgi:ABC-type transporter Mla maintaining outer membrane lipid asymmetry ATPase subunit MlaF